MAGNGNGHDWSQGRLAQELREVGVQIGQTDLSRLEREEATAGKEPRSVTIEDLYALAFVLDVPPLALLLPQGDERLRILPEEVAPRDPQRLQFPSGPIPGRVKALPRTASGASMPVQESRDKAAAWIVGKEPLKAQREPKLYRRYGRQDVQTTELPDLGAFMRHMADQLDAENLDDQEQIILAVREHLSGALRAVRLLRQRRDRDSVGGGQH